MRVGVIGRGFGERVVAPAFRGTEGCEVVDVVSPRDDAAVAALCARADVDLVSVHSPPFLHLDHVRRAVDAGHDVLCDKPFGRDAAEAEAMRDLARDAGVLHFGNFENRYDATRAAVRAAVAEGAVGRPEHVVLSALMAIWRVPLRPYGWLFDAAAGGGWLRAMGSHQIDFARWAFGEVVAVAGQLRTTVAERPDADGTLHPCTADDGYAVALRTDRGVSVLLDGSAAAPSHRPSSLLVVGSDGVIEESSGRIVVHPADGGDERELLLTAPAGNPLVAAMTTYAAVVRDAVHTRHVPADVPTFDDGVACATVMHQLV